MYRIFEGLFNLLSKIKIISKKMIGLENKTFKFVENFQQGMGLLFKRKRVFSWGNVSSYHSNFIIK